MGTIYIRLEPLGKEIIAESGTSLIDILHEYGVEFPCGGKGSCGNCKIKLISGSLSVNGLHAERLEELALDRSWRLACMSIAEENLVLEVGQYEAMIQADDTPFSFEPRYGYGIAVDLGTTTLVAQLVDRSTSRVLAVETAMNPQRRWGNDLISRLEAALAGNDHLLTRLIREEIGRMLLKLTEGKEVVIEKVVIVGNTVMQHFFNGSDIRPLSFYPFESPVMGAKKFSALELDWSIGCNDICFYPSIGSFVGSDILAGIHATGMSLATHYSVLVDLGTNGEIVVGNSEKLLCASTAAGPAFEGARISMGMLATTGAISSVDLKGDDILCKVIGNVEAAGICGSGLIDAVAIWLESGLLGQFGEIQSGEAELRLTGRVVLTQKDIQEFQLAKAAIAAGLTILMKRLDITPDDVSQVFIAGAFGTYINLDSVVRTGMMDFPADRFHKLGNSALIGAKMFLFSDEGKKKEILRITEHVHLESDKEFQTIFVDQLAFT